MGRNRVIGVDGSLPWHLPDDLKRFKAITMGKPLIMGRATFDSIGRVLPGRTNIVVSRREDLEIEGALVASSPGHALVLALRESPTEVVVAGGGTMYDQFMPMAHRIELTVVDLAPAGDTVFPPLGEGWVTVAEEHVDGDPSLTYQTWERSETTVP